MAQEPSLGNLSDQSFIFKELTWELPDVLSFPRTADFEVRSPEFYFADSTWVLCMYPYGQTQCGTDSYVDFKIRRQLSLEPEKNVFFEIFLVTHRGEQFGAFRSWYSFHVDSPCYVVKNFMKYSDLAEKWETLAPKGTFTIGCHMRAKCLPAVEDTSLSGVAKAAIKSTESQKRPAAQDRNVLGDLKQLLLSKDGCDVTLQVGGQKFFQAHRAILIARSPVFASMLKHDMKEKNTGLVCIQDCDPETFPDFLRFLYCGSVESITLRNACSLYRAADKYDVQDLKSECLTFIKSNLAVGNFCDVITLALQYGEADLIKQATEFFAKNMPKIIVTVKWQVFLAANPTESNELLIKAVGASRQTCKWIEDIKSAYYKLFPPSNEWF